MGVASREHAFPYLGLMTILIGIGCMNTWKHRSPFLSHFD